MLSIAIPLALAIVAIAMALNFWRLAKGPSAPDRIPRTRHSRMMGFVGTVALCKFLLSGDTIG
jgi:multicomponent K+:H+ antiporter subunit F